MENMTDLTNIKKQIRNGSIEVRCLGGGNKFVDIEALARSHDELLEAAKFVHYAMTTDATQSCSDYMDACDQLGRAIARAESE